MLEKWCDILWENTSEQSRCNHQKRITSATQWFLLLIFPHWTRLSFFQTSKLTEKNDWFKNSQGILQISHCWGKKHIHNLHNNDNVTLWSWSHTQHKQLKSNSWPIVNSPFLTCEFNSSETFWLIKHIWLLTLFEGKHYPI